MLTAALDGARQGFEQNRGLDQSSSEYTAAVQHAEDVAKILRENIVQGKKEGENLYRLNIHDDTERGDNNTVKLGSPGSKSECCGGNCA
jgi:complex III assembly factor LYRM7